VIFGKIIGFLTALEQLLMTATMLVTGQIYFSSLQMISSQQLMNSGLKMMAMFTHLKTKVILGIRILMR
tara:strand:- start:379 stop:585 length:207 start_codon:yes stop_codon:yes gene_type:complete